MSVSIGVLHWLAESLVEAYLDDRIDAGLKPKTIEWYRWHLTRAIDWLEAEPGYHALDVLTVDGLRSYYRSTRNLADTTRRYMVAALHAFGAWLGEFELENPACKLKKPRKTRRLPEVVCPSELARLVSLMDSFPLREQALLTLFLDAGLRVSEVASLKRADVDLASGQLTVRDGKGSKGRVVFFFTECVSALAAYLETHDHEYVFVSERVGRPPAPLTDNGIRQILRRLAKKHGFDNLRPHTLRRTCGTEMVANGVDLSTVADQFGHEDIATVQIYTRLADERRREALRRASPVDRIMRRRPVPAPEWPKPRT
jgi:site-specific recombinase XerD